MPLAVPQIPSTPTAPPPREETRLRPSPRRASSVGSRRRAGSRWQCWPSPELPRRDRAPLCRRIRPRVPARCEPTARPTRTRVPACRGHDGAARAVPGPNGCGRAPPRARPSLIPATTPISRVCVCACCDFMRGGAFTPRACSTRMHANACMYTHAHAQAPLHSHTHVRTHTRAHARTRTYLVAHAGLEFSQLARQLLHLPNISVRIAPPPPPRRRRHPGPPSIYTPQKKMKMKCRTIAIAESLAASCHTHTHVRRVDARTTRRTCACAHTVEPRRVRALLHPQAQLLSPVNARECGVRVRQRLRACVRACVPRSRIGMGLS